MNAEQHWNNVYTSKAPNEVSWFQSYPETSVRFVESCNLPLDANIIDIGGGGSLFAEALLDKGYNNIYVLDISAKAIEKARQRLGKRALQLHWIVADVTAFEPPVQFDLWHDRAAFHFLTTDDDISKYISTARHAVKQNGYLVMATFSEKGPKKCSGLNIQQYSEISMASKFEAAFDKIECKTEDHTTPFNTIQNFLFCRFRRK